MTGRQGAILLFMKSDHLAQSLEKAFVANGYQTMLVKTEDAVLTAMKEAVPSLLIIERQHGSSSSLRQLRMATTIPIVALATGEKTSADDESLKGYEEEIDLVLSYQTPRELVARVRAILRRSGPPAEQVHRRYRAGNIKMDLDRHEVTVDGHTIELTPKEFKILLQFIEAPGRVFSRQEMLNRVWGEGYALEEHALDVHIHSLRQKIEINPTEPSLIVTVRGVGYKLRA
jgi:two-component system, OmpR family, response regulator RegX3